MENYVKHYNAIMEELEKQSEKKEVRKFLELAAERDKCLDRAKNYVKTVKRDVRPFAYGTRKDTKWDVGILRRILPKKLFEEITEVVVCKEGLKAAIKKEKVTEEELVTARSETLTDIVRGGINPWKIGI